VGEVKSYDAVVAIGHSSGHPPTYKSVVEIVAPAEQKGSEVWLESPKELREGDVLRARAQKVQFLVSDLRSHRSEYFQNGRAQVIYRFRLEEIRDPMLLEKKPNQSHPSQRR
jgi:hypothetical protein